MWKVQCVLSRASREMLTKSSEPTPKGQPVVYLDQPRIEPNLSLKRSFNLTTFRAYHVCMPRSHQEPDKNRRCTTS